MGRTTLSPAGSFNRSPRFLTYRFRLICIELNRGSRLLIHFILPLLFWLFLATGAHAEVASREGPPQPALLAAKTLERTEDPVVLTGKDLPGMLTRPITGLRVFALHGRGMLLIPHQVDEVDEKGRIISTEGKHPGRDKDNGRFDANDELVVMASDLGARGPRDLYPRGARAASEVEVTDRATGGKGWFYVFDFDIPPPPSPISYVHYDPGKDLAETPLYVMDFNESNAILLDDLQIKNPSGDKVPNLIDRLKIRTVFKTRLYLTFHLDEEDITSRVTGYKNGPIRAVRATEFYLRLFFLKVTPSAFVDYLFYRNAVVGPGELKIPFSPRLLLRRGSSGLSGFDFNSNIYGWKFYSEKNPVPITLTGGTKEGKTLERDGVSWFALYGESGGTMVRVVFGQSLIDAGLDYVLYYLDDREHENKPEREKGEAFLGFYTDLLKIPRGTHKMWFYQFFAAPYAKADEKKFNNILDHPLEFKALAVSTPAPTAAR